MKGPVDGYELNLSCPNVEKGGMAFGTEPELVERITRKVRKITRRALVVKLSPNVTDIAQVALAAEAGKADVVILGTYRWLGSFQSGMVQLAEALAGTGTPLVVVPLGNPDDLRFLPVRPDAYLAVYGYREANLLGAAAVLTGAVAPRGVLPVPVGEYPVGSGDSGF